MTKAIESRKQESLCTFVAVQISYSVRKTVNLEIAHVFHCKCAMDDKLSIKSSDSVTTSGEYEIVPEELESYTTQSGTSPTLNIANNGNFNDLEKNLDEVIDELDHNTMATNLEIALTEQIETGKCHALLLKLIFMKLNLKKCQLIFIVI